MRTVSVFCVAMLFAVRPAAAADGNNATGGDRAEIAVIGDAWSRSEPDFLRLVVTLEESGKTAADAVKAVEEKTERITAAVKTLTPDAAIEKRGERFAGPGKSPTITSAGIIQLSRHIGIATGETGKAGALIDAVLAAGATAVVDVELSVRGDSKQLAEAANAAAVRAKQKAEALAHSLGVRLGNLVEAVVTEEPQAAIAQQQQQLGESPQPTSDREHHVYVNLRYSVEKP